MTREQHTEDEESPGGDDAAARRGGICGDGGHDSVSSFQGGGAGLERRCPKEQAYNVSAAVFEVPSDASRRAAIACPPLRSSTPFTTIWIEAMIGHRDDRADHAQQRPEDHHAEDDEESRDVRRLAEDRRLQDVVLELLVDEHDASMISAGVSPCVRVASTRIVPAMVAPIMGIRSRSPAITPITTG